MANSPPPRYTTAAAESTHSLPLPHSHYPHHTLSTSSLRSRPLPPHPPAQPPLPPTPTNRIHRPYPNLSAPTEIQLPEWQPDASAKCCPICDTLFTWFNRRHHCRKCGRVVCASCSPHRITIPAAFVVHPPDAPPPVPIIDSTSSRENSDAARRERTWNNHPLEEEDDDDDEDQETYSDDDEDEDDDDEAAQVRICEDCLGWRASGGRSVSNPGVMYGGESSNSVAVPNDRRRRQSTHGGRSLPPPRHAPIQRGHAHSNSEDYSRPQLAETDYCPICHRALPYLVDPSEEGREAHITSCITAATASPSSPRPTPGVAKPGGRMRSYTNTGRMVVWHASAKDCYDPATQETVECVICFEDFEEKQEIARLECLCRYHKKCIRDWFDRKGNGECPVHAVHD